jgi:hypothetical protein
MNMSKHRSEAAGCSRVATRGGLEEEENEEFKYRVYRNIQRTQGSKLGEWIMGDIGTAGVTIH